MGPLFDENQSVWAVDRPPRDAYPPLVGEASVDLAILGGGFTGMSAAWHFSRRYPEMGIALFEAARLGNGASGRNGGMMLNWIVGLESADLDMAHLSYDATSEGIETIGEVLRELDAPHLWRHEGSVDVYTDPRSAALAQRECERLQAGGIPIRWLEPAELAAGLTLEGVFGGQLDPGAGQLDGFGLIEAMAPVLAGRGVSLHEGSPVLRIREGAVHELELPRGRVRARHLVLATNAYTPRLGYFRHSLIPLHSHVVGSRARSPEQWAALGWKGLSGFADDSGRVAYGALTPRGELVFGGGSNQSYSYLYGGETAYAGDRRRHIQAVRARLLRYMPGLGDLELPYQWSGPIGLTLSRLCSIGVMGEHRNVYYGLGYSGHGVTLANLAGRILCDIHAGEDARWRPLPFFGHTPLPIPPEPMRWIGYHAYTRLTGRSPRRRLG